jgi:undecaprenyl-phosphate 4-deoxy-4-formamido-L-arabinose transferase
VSDEVVLSVVIPVYNEAGNLAELVDRCLRACAKTRQRFEIVLVDDGSTDESAAIIDRAAARHPGMITGVFLNRNYGQHAAIMAGFAQANGAIVVTLDADLQNPPEEIPRLAAAAAQGFDVVGTVRTRRRDSLFRKLASAMINRTVQRSTGVMMHDYGCMLRAYRRHIVEVQHHARSHGESKYSVSKLIVLMFDLLTSMTTFPLRVLSVLGVAVAVLGMGFGAVLLIMRVHFGAEWAGQGVFTLFAVLFFFVGAQFIAMGLLGEYIGRIYHDVKARPRYFVQRVRRSETPRNEAEGRDDGRRDAVPDEGGRRARPAREEVP